jgi:hypothetical protein
MLALTDVIRLSHILVVSVGFGAAFLADFYTLTCLGRPVDDPLVHTLEVCHGLIWKALLGMWLTGVAMIFLRTGFIIENFSPKLFTKLITVSVLTLNATLIGMIAMPILMACKGRSLLTLPLGRKLGLGIIGALSSTSWLLAMSLGISKVLAQSGWDVFVRLLPLAYAVGALAAIVLMLVLHSRPETEESGLAVQA